MDPPETWSHKYITLSGTARIIRLEILRQHYIVNRFTLQPRNVVRVACSASESSSLVP
jgi:hypothetical protein